MELIPPEILGEIFENCLPTDHSKPSAPDVLLCLSRTCRVWRETCLTTPTLWSLLYVDTSKADKKGIASWLNRSGALPLSLGLFDPPGSRDIEPLNEALNGLTFHIDRWKDIQFRFFEPHAHHLAPIPESGAPLLENIEIEAYCDIPREWFIPLFENSPRLRALSWTPSPGFDLRTLSIPWNQLTSLSLRFMLSLDECIHILRQSPNLVTCRVDVHAYQFAQPSPNLVELPALRSLEVCINHRQALGILFDQLVLPSVRSIALRQGTRVRDWQVSWPQSQFISLTWRSGCPLERLVFSLINLSEDDIIECLQSKSNSLSVLNIGEQTKACITDRVLRLLTPRYGNDGVLSGLALKLERIRFYRCMTSTDGVLADMIQSRWALRRSGEVNQLDTVKVHIPVDHEEDMRRLIRLRDEGLSVEFLF